MLEKLVRFSRFLEPQNQSREMEVLTILAKLLDGKSDKIEEQKLTRFEITENSLPIMVRFKKQTIKSFSKFNMAHNLEI